MLKDIESKSQIIKNFSPAWFASVMGTGVLANGSYMYSDRLSVLKDMGNILFYFNVILFIILLIPWTLRWLFFKKQAISDLEHPINSNFYATMAIAILVLSSNFTVIGKNTDIARILWIIGVPLTIFFAVFTPYIMFKTENTKIGHITPSWFIPPVGLIVIPLAGAPIMNTFTGSAYDLAVFINYFSWGSGFFLYISLLAISVYRMILHQPLPSQLAPTIWINLGPIGAGAASLISLIAVTSFITVKEPLYVFALIFWGSGIWWIMMSVALTVHYIRRLKLPYALSWWAFTFPIGAYVAGSHSVSKIFNIKLFDDIGFLMYWLLLFIWSLTLYYTAIHTYHGTHFREVKNG